MQFCVSIMRETVWRKIVPRAIFSHTMNFEKKRIVVCKINKRIRSCFKDINTYSRVTERTFLYEKTTRNPLKFYMRVRKKKL